MDGAVRIERVIDLPLAIVWDAVVDPVLVEGWLHPVLRLVDPERAMPDPAAGLSIRSDELGEVRVSASMRAGGTRGSSTVLLVEIGSPDPRFRSAIRESWLTRLDQLEDLLRGHPTVWATEQSAQARRARAN